VTALGGLVVVVGLALVVELGLVVFTRRDDAEYVSDAWRRDHIQQRRGAD